MEHAEDVYLYGPPLNISRQYNLLFRKKSQRVKIKPIFYKMSRETTGDFFALSALITAYSNRMREVAHEELARIESDKDEIGRFTGIQ